MAKKKDNQRRFDAKWRSEDQIIQVNAVRAPFFKIVLRKRGCSLPFYDLLDSYPAEFDRIVTWAKKEYPSLLDVYEVEDGVFLKPDRYWNRFGCENLTQICFGDDHSQYYERTLEGNLAGTTSAFNDEDGALRTVVLISSTVSGYRR